MTTTRIRFWPHGTSREAAQIVTVDVRHAGDLGGWRAQLPVYSDSDVADFYDVEQLTDDERVIGRSTATMAMVVGRQQLVLRGTDPFQPVLA